MTYRVWENYIRGAYNLREFYPDIAAVFDLLEEVGEKCFRVESDYYILHSLRQGVQLGLITETESNRMIKEIKKAPKLRKPTSRTPAYTSGLPSWAR